MREKFEKALEGTILHTSMYTGTPFSTLFQGPQIGMLFLGQLKVIRKEELNPGLFIQKLHCSPLDYSCPITAAFSTKFKNIVHKEKLSANSVSKYVAEMVKFGGKQMNSLPNYSIK